MIEPTESEPLYELDRLCNALIKIREEIREVETGKVSAEHSVLRGAPHTADVVLSDTWDRKYSREQAAYPLEYLRESKFWPTVGRIDNVFGDRNVVCTCPPLSDYQ
jgi:glycine dehydrogenase